MCASNAVAAWIAFYVVAYDANTITVYKARSIMVRGRYNYCINDLIPH